MFLNLVLVAATLIGPTQAQFDDMEDDAFAAYLASHDNAREWAAQYGDSMGRGCVKGAVGGAFTGKGFQALCIGCAIGAAGEIAGEMTFPRDPQDRD